jgi:hypothetical protein
MTTVSLVQDKLSARLSVALSRWSLASAFMLLASSAFYSGMGGLTEAEKALGPQYRELMQAARSPVFFRLGTGCEALYWLMIGGTFVIFAVLSVRRAPIRAAFIAGCGVAQLTGSLGALLGMNSISDLAGRYAGVATDQQAALLQSFLVLNSVILSNYMVATLLQAAAFLLIAWLAWRWIGFPRWLAVWLIIPGVFALALFTLQASGSPAGIVLPLGVIALISVHVAITVAFWRPPATFVAGAARAGAAM